VISAECWFFGIVKKKNCFLSTIWKFRGGKKDFLSNKMRKLLQQQIDDVELEGGQIYKNRVNPSCHIPLKSHL